MAIFKTDFSEFSTGVKPTGWTTGAAGLINSAGSDAAWVVEADAGATGGQVLKFDAATQTERFIIYPDVPASEHQRAKFRWKPVGQNGSDLRLFGRADGASAPNATSGYTLGVRSADLDINKYSAGTFSNLNNDTGGYTATDGAWYFTECEIVGINPTTLKVKTWPESGTEPPTFSELGGGPEGAVTDTDATDVESGGFGLFALVTSVVSVDWLVVTTAGEDPEFAAGSTPTLGTVPATAFPGQSRTVTGTNFGATQGTGGLTIGGVVQAITSWSDTEIIFTTVLGTNSYGTGKTLEVTTDAATTVSDTIELVADTANGFGYVDMSSPNTTDESSVAFGASPTVVTGDQFEWEDFNNLGNLTVDAQGFVTNVDTEGTFRGRFWDATDSTWGTVETFTASVPGEEDTWPFGKGINPAATKNWTWGRRHPKTNMRVRVYK